MSLETLKKNGFDDLEPENQIAVINTVKALRLKEKIEKLELTAKPRLFVGATGFVRIHIDARGKHNAPYIIRELTKLLKTKFEKQRGVQGFLRYRGYIDELPITVNTSECFYGGNPKVVQFPRTRAYCPIEVKKR